jgi:uncharacterized protein (DUF1684 family)
MKIIFNWYHFLTLAFLLCFINSCGRTYTPEQQKYISGIEKQRKEKDEYMKNDPSSPFNQDPKAHFQNLKYYDVNPDYVFKSRLFEYRNKDTVKIFGTKGEERKAVRIGYVKINFKEGERNVNVYKGISRNGEEYYSIWFTDLTTGDETYGVGRYLDFELNPDKDFIYTIDFNLAYNPYCSYSSKYSCAIPTKEDHIDAAIRAGEKRFH